MIGMLIQRDRMQLRCLIGLIPGYIVQHSEVNEGIWHSSSPIQQTECIVEHLSPGATYHFRIIGENLLGFGPPSPNSEPIIYSTELVPPTFITRLRDLTAIENERVGREINGILATTF